MGRRACRLAEHERERPPLEPPGDQRHQIGSETLATPPARSSASESSDVRRTAMCHHRPRWPSGTSRSGSTSPATSSRRGRRPAIACSRHRRRAARADLRGGRRADARWRGRSRGRVGSSRATACSCSSARRPSGTRSCWRDAARRGHDPVLGDAARQGPRLPGRALGRAARRRRPRRRRPSSAGLDAALFTGRGRAIQPPTPRPARTRRPRTPPSSSTPRGRRRTRRASPTRTPTASRSGCRRSAGSTRGPGDLVWCTAGTGWAKSIWNVLLGPWSARRRRSCSTRARSTRASASSCSTELGVTVLCQAPTEYRLMAKLDAIDRSTSPASATWSRRASRSTPR